MSHEFSAGMQSPVSAFQLYLSSIHVNNRNHQNEVCLLRHPTTLMRTERCIITIRDCWINHQLD